MNKGSQTRQRILETAATLLNQQGWMAFSISALLTETGLEKGGLYNHFKSKEELAFATFDYLVARQVDRFRQAAASADHAAAKLRAIMHCFLDMRNAPIGGCPIMNAAIESDDAYPGLCERARAAMDGMLAFLRRVITDGQTAGQIRPEIDPHDIAIHVVSTLEGALMLAKLYRNPDPLQRAIQHLHGTIAGITTQAGERS